MEPSSPLAILIVARRVSALPIRLQPPRLQLSAAHMWTASALSPSASFASGLSDWNSAASWAMRSATRSAASRAAYSMAACSSAFQYLGATLALLLAVPQAEYEGPARRAAGRGHDDQPLGRRLDAACRSRILIVVSVVGATSAWLSGSARILFVSRHRSISAQGLRPNPPASIRILPTSRCRHRRSLLCLIAMSFAGRSTVKEAYVTLIDLAVVLQMISYLYIYASLARVAFRRPDASASSTGDHPIRCCERHARHALWHAWLSSRLTRSTRSGASK